MVINDSSRRVELEPRLLNTWHLAPHTAGHCLSLPYAVITSVITIAIAVTKVTIAILTPSVITVSMETTIDFHPPHHHHHHSCILIISVRCLHGTLSILSTFLRL